MQILCKSDAIETLKVEIKLNLHDAYTAVININFRVMLIAFYEQKLAAVMPSVNG